MVKQKFTKNEYSGKLVSVDAYFNLQLKNCKEHRYDDLGFIDVVTLGDALIRWVFPSACVPRLFLVALMSSTI